MDNIMRDNLLYLEAWMSYNPQLRTNLSIEKNELIYKDENRVDKVDISHFYLPNLLYNKIFRDKISLQKDLTSKDLFKIIKLYIETEEITEKEQLELQMSPKIREIKRMMDENNEKEFIAIIDENNNKYRFDTEKPEKVIDEYLILNSLKGYVTLKELGSVVHYGN